MLQTNIKILEEEDNENANEETNAPKHRKPSKMRMSAERCRNLSQHKQVVNGANEAKLVDKKFNSINLFAHTVILIKEIFLSNRANLAWLQQ